MWLLYKRGILRSQDHRRLSAKKYPILKPGPEYQSACTLKITQRCAGVSHFTVVFLNSGVLQFCVSSWAASSFEMSGNNYRTTRRRNRNNCFLNMKTCLKTVISFRTVSFPVGWVGTFPLNFAPTSPVSRYTSDIIAASLTMKWAQWRTLHCSLCPVSHRHARRTLGCHRRLANQLYKYYTSWQQESHFFHISGVAGRQYNTEQFATRGTVVTTCTVYFENKGLWI